MNNYIFRFPADTPLFDFESLRNWLGEKNQRHAGTTVTVRFKEAEVLEVRLYDFPIALIRPGTVTFLPSGDDAHMATSEWISLIARHNGINGWISRRRRRKSDGPGVPVARGVAGVLEIGGNPVVRGTFDAHIDQRRLWHSEREQPEASR